MADYPELADIQNEDNAKNWKNPPTLIKPYMPGQGPNAGFHDSGVGVLTRAVEKSKFDSSVLDETER